jgi:hypothetical protein
MLNHDRQVKWVFLRVMRREFRFDDEENDLRCDDSVDVTGQACDVSGAAVSPTMYWYCREAESMATTIGQRT